MKPPSSLFLILLLALPLAAQTAAVQQTEKCTIEGTVTRAGSGAPVAKVEVLLQGSQEPLLVTTDASGRFVVNDLEPGRYSLTADRNGYVAQKYGQRGKNRKGVDLILGPGQKLRDIDFRLVPTGVVTGCVSGEDGEPQPGASVQAFAFHYIQGQRQMIAAGEASTNDLGEYRIYGLEPGHYYLGASQKERHGTMRRPKGAPPEQSYIPTFYPSVENPKQATAVDVGPGSEVRGVDITALRSRTFHIRGKILWETLGAQPRRLVPAMLQRLEPGFDVVYRDIIGDAQGNFDLGGIVPGSYILTANVNSTGKWNRAWQQIEVGDSDLAGISLTLSMGMDLPGRVRVEWDKEIDVSRLIANLWPRHFSFLGVTSARVNPEGSFLLQNAPRDAHQVGLYGLPEDFYLKSVRLGDEEVTGRSIDLTGAGAPPGPVEIVVSASGGRIDGVVKSEKDEPASSATVVLVPDSSHRRESYLFRSTTTDQNGRLTMRGIPPGEYKLFAWEDVESGAWEDPEFLKPYEDKGEKVKVEPNGRVTRDLRLIPAEAAPQ